MELDTEDIQPKEERPRFSRKIMDEVPEVKKTFHRIGPKGGRVYVPQPPPIPAPHFEMNLRNADVENAEGEPAKHFEMSSRDGESVTHSEPEALEGFQMHVRSGESSTSGDSEPAPHFEMVSRSADVEQIDAALELAPHFEMVARAGESEKKAEVENAIS